jgi:3-oxoadipate enol-lactonase
MGERGASPSRRACEREVRVVPEYDLWQAACEPPQAPRCSTRTGRAWDGIFCLFLRPVDPVSRMEQTFVKVNGLPVHYRLEGAPAGALVMLCHGLLGSLEMWQPQMRALGERYRVLRFDNRGHGSSGVTAPPYTVEQLAADAVGLLDVLGVPRAHFVGCSLGGMIGQLMGARYPERLRSLVLVSSRTVMPPASMWEERIRIARTSGIAALLPTMLERWFSPSFRASDRSAVDAVAAAVLATPVEGFVGACTAIRDTDHTRLLPRVAVPTLVMSAQDDPGVPVPDTICIQRAIPGAELALVEGARHLFSVERADVFDALLLKWLARH